MVGGSDTTILDSILAGVHDTFLSNTRVMLSQQGIYYYRFGFEMNGDWMAWGMKPERFKRAWIHVWKLFQQTGAKT